MLIMRYNLQGQKLTSPNVLATGQRLTSRGSWSVGCPPQCPSAPLPPEQWGQRAPHASTPGPAVHAPGFELGAPLCLVPLEDRVPGNSCSLGHHACLDAPPAHGVKGVFQATPPGRARTLGLDLQEPQRLVRGPLCRGSASARAQPVRSRSLGCVGPGLSLCGCLGSHSFLRQETKAGSLQWGDHVVGCGREPHLQALGVRVVRGLGADAQTGQSRY